MKLSVAFRRLSQVGQKKYGTFHNNSKVRDKKMRFLNDFLTSYRDQSLVLTFIINVYDSISNARKSSSIKMRIQSRTKRRIAKAEKHESKSDRRFSRKLGRIGGGGGIRAESPVSTERFRFGHHRWRHRRAPGFGRLHRRGRGHGSRAEGQEEVHYGRRARHDREKIRGHRGKGGRTVFLLCPVS